MLTIFNAGPEDSGEYVSNAHNMLGEATTKTLLLVSGEYSELTCLQLVLRRPQTKATFVC